MLDKFGTPWKIFFRFEKLKKWRNALKEEYENACKFGVPHHEMMHRGGQISNFQRSDGFCNTYPVGKYGEDIFMSVARARQQEKRSHYILSEEEAIKMWNQYHLLCDDRFNYLLDQRKKEKHERIKKYKQYDDFQKYLDSKIRKLNIQIKKKFPNTFTHPVFLSDEYACYKNIMEKYSKFKNEKK